MIYLQVIALYFIFASSFYGIYCWVMKSADMPSSLGGKDEGINQAGDHTIISVGSAATTNRLVQVRLLPQQLYLTKKDLPMLSAIPAMVIMVL